MAWQQVRTPQLDPYIVQPNGNGGTYTLTDWLGWCLAYVQTAFGTGWGGNTAWDCWNNHAINKHADWNLPSGVYVPIFFSGAGGDGHIAIYKDGQIWSAPITHKPYADVWGSIQTVQAKYGVTYVGWAEGIGGTLVIQPQNDPVVAPTVATPTFTVIEEYTTPKTIQLNKQPTNLWGLNYTDPGANAPVEVHDMYEKWPVTNKVHHINGYDYYRREGQVDGFNVLDCDDYVAPTPPAPYVPPAAPVKGTSAETYELLTTLKYYGSANDAIQDNNALGTLAAKKYFVWEKGGTNQQVYNLTDDNTKNKNQWINIIENKRPLSPPKPAPVEQPKPTTVTLQSTPRTETTADIMASWKWFYPDHSPVEYEIVKDYLVRDVVHTGTPIPIKAGRSIEIYGTFTAKGTTYLRPLTSLDEKGMYNMYGIPTGNLYTGEPYLENVFNTSDRIRYGWDMFLDKTIKTIEGIFQWRNKK